MKVFLPFLAMKLYFDFHFFRLFALSCMKIILSIFVFRTILAYKSSFLKISSWTTGNGFFSTLYKQLSIDGDLELKRVISLIMLLTCLLYLHECRGSFKKIACSKSAVKCTKTYKRFTRHPNVPRGSYYFFPFSGTLP